MRAQLPSRRRSTGSDEGNSIPSQPPPIRPALQRLEVLTVCQHPRQSKVAMRSSAGSVTVCGRITSWSSGGCSVYLWCAVCDAQKWTWL